MTNTTIYTNLGINEKEAILMYRSGHLWEDIKRVTHLTSWELIELFRRCKEEVT